MAGLNPADKFAPLPVTPSPAKFRRRAADPQRRSGLRKRNPRSHGPRRITCAAPLDAKPSLLAEAFAAPTSALNMREAMRLAQAGPVIFLAPLRSKRRPPPRAWTRSLHRAALPLKQSGAPDPRFNNRDVYMMAIQMPNLTSDSGSWLMWYADRTAREIGLAPVSPPVAHRKVDPKYAGLRRCRSWLKPKDPAGMRDRN